MMAIIPLYGHETVQATLRESFAAGRLPASILFHGPRGVGKQRLAQWLAQLILCTGANKPCGECLSCRYALDLRHPDLHWFFPRPRLKDSDPDAESVRDDIEEALDERRQNSGLYAPASGSEGIFVATVRALVHTAALKPAIGARKVFIIGDAERMVPQEGSEQAANAFLKLLEEPPADTTIIITSSEPGALLPTIRSRVAPVRVPRLSEAEVQQFLANPAVAKQLGASGALKERVRIAAGAPGRLLAGEGPENAMTAARKMLEAATAPSESTLFATSLAQGSASARGAFSETLEALLVTLNERVHDAMHAQDEMRAYRTARAVDAVALAQQRAEGNVNPQLITARLLREIRASLA
jgi:DNA polymerase-3 subunit delta'